MRVLLTGGTGFIGYEVAQQLARSEHEVRLLVRRISRAPLVANLQRFGGVEIVQGDLNASVSIERAMQGMDAVIHLAGRATFEPYERLAPSLVHGSATLAAAAVRAGVGHIVFGSSAFVYAGDAATITRETPTRPVLGYGRAKVDAEKVLESETQNSDTTVTSLRLPHVYGQHSLLFGLIRRRIVVFPGPGDNMFAQLHVSDAARALIAAAEQRLEGAFAIADHSQASWNDFFDVLRTYAPRTRVVRVPAELAIAGTRLVWRPLGRITTTMLAPDTIRGWNLDVRIEDDAVWDLLDLEPEFATIADGIPATLDAAVAFRWTHPINDWS